MPKYWGENYFAHGRFPKLVKSKKRRKKCTNLMQEAVLECRLPKSGTRKRPNEQSHIYGGVLAHCLKNIHVQSLFRH